MGKRKEKKQAVRAEKKARKQNRGRQPEQKPKQKVELKDNPLYPERVESNAKGVLIAIASVVVAIILLVVIVKNFSYAFHPYSYDQTESDGDRETDYAEFRDEESTDSDEGDDSNETAEAEGSGIDIDAVSNPYAEFTGTLTDAGGAYAVMLGDSYNICAYNDDGEQVVMDDVDQILLIDTGGWEIDGSVGEEVIVGGYLEISGQDMTMTLENFEGPETAEDTAIHKYEIVIADCTWSEAMQAAQEKGGYLVRINSQEEYDVILNQLNAGDYTKYHFYLGGRRDSDGTDYYWVDNDDQFIGECLNDSSFWCVSAWYEGEPSYADGDVAEDAMNLFCVNGKWYLNDSSMDLVGNYPDLMAGKVGYIVEYE